MWTISVSVSVKRSVSLKTLLYNILMTVFHSKFYLLWFDIVARLKKVKCSKYFKQLREGCRMTLRVIQVIDYVLFISISSALVLPQSTNYLNWCLVFCDKMNIFYFSWLVWILVGKTLTKIWTSNYLFYHL